MGSSPSSGGQPLWGPTEVNQGRTLLVNIMRATKEKFPHIAWFDQVQLDLDFASLSEPGDLVLSLAANGAPGDKWGEFMHVIGACAKPYGYEAPDVTETGKIGNHMTVLHGQAGRLIQVSSARGTTVTLTAPNTKLADSTSLQNGLVWRDGKNVMEPRAPA